MHDYVAFSVTVFFFVLIIVLITSTSNFYTNCCVLATMPVSMSPGATTPLIDGTTTTFFTNEQTSADTQMTQTMPGNL